ncbi:MAG: AGE family epimerase/isomerase [Pseudomonadota bacterium]
MTTIVQITPSAPPAKPLEWLIDTALPVWASTGFNQAAGCFVECLDARGTPQLAAPTRLRVQARQTYVFSHAYHLTKDPRWAERAQAGLAFLITYGWDQDHGGWVHRLTPEGQVLDDRRDAYDHAFMLFALAWYGKAFGFDAVQPWIDKTLAFLDQHIAAPNSGYHEDCHTDGGQGFTDHHALPRRQNPHMHLLEAFLTLYAGTGDTAMLARARQMIGLFEQHFFDAQSGSLGEYFTDDWQPDAGASGGVREPGHHFEWVWLLDQYQQTQSTRLTTDYGAKLFAWAQNHGLRPTNQHSLAIDHAQADGSNPERGARLWPQTEMIKASLIQAEDADRAALADHGLMVLFHHYLDQQTGLWNDRIDQHDRPVSTTIPASSLYHIMMAFTEWERLRP